MRLHYHHICSAALPERFEESLTDESEELGINYRSSTIYLRVITDYGDIGPVRFGIPFSFAKYAHNAVLHFTHVSLPWRYHLWRVGDYFLHHPVGL